MSTEPKSQVLRLQKSHAPDPEPPPDLEIGRRLLRAQSVHSAVLAGLILVVLFSGLWALLSLALDRFFPWLSLLLGMLTGLTVRRAGLGLDWRFPVIAALLAVLGSLLGNLVVALAFAASSGGVLPAVASFDWMVFFGDILTPADGVYALFAAAIAAFYSMRRLSRRQYLALRLFKEAGPSSDGH